MHQRHAIKQSMIEVARNAVQMKLSVDDIVKLTDLPREEVERLRNTN